MPPRRSGPSSAPVRRFVLAVAPDHGEPELAAEDVRHALTVLRLRAGDALVGLDGRGAAWPLVVERVARDELVLRQDGEPTREPRAGTSGAPVPWIEVRTPLPRGDRATAMLDRLTQLGISRVVARTTERTAEHARDVSANRRRRLRRALDEACKQSGRLWTPELVFEDDATPDGSEPVGSEPVSVVTLEPRAELALATWLDEREPSVTGLRFELGPEGGWSDDERAVRRDAGATEVRLAPYVLRIETAAEAAVAATVAHWVATR